MKLYEQIQDHCKVEINDVYTTSASFDASDDTIYVWRNGPIAISFSIEDAVKFSNWVLKLNSEVK